MAAADCVNIPLMRRLELQNGIMLETAEGEKVGESLTAARRGIGMVTASRIAMAAPGLTPASSLTSSIDTSNYIFFRNGFDSIDHE